MQRSRPADRLPHLRVSIALCLALGAPLALAACHAPPKPPVVVKAPLPLPPPAAPPAPPLPVPAPVRTGWSFATGSAGCAAQAAGEAGGFGVTVGTDGSVVFTISGIGNVLPLPAGVPVAVDFAGPAGSWTLPGKIDGKSTVAAGTAGGDEALGMLLAVLGGGTARAGNAALGLPAIEIPPAGAAGSQWFSCARNREHG